VLAGTSRSLNESGRRAIPGPKTFAYLVGPLGIQLPRRLTEKVSQESVTSEPNNSSQDDHGGADYRGEGNKGRGE
jgi:hypothetical protein